MCVPKSATCKCAFLHKARRTTYQAPCVVCRAAAKHAPLTEQFWQERLTAAAQRQHADELRAQMAGNAERMRAAREAARSEGAEGRARQATHQAAIEARTQLELWGVVR